MKPSSWFSSDEQQPILLQIIVNQFLSLLLSTTKTKKSPIFSDGAFETGSAGLGLLELVFAGGDLCDEILVFGQLHILLGHFIFLFQNQKAALYLLLLAQDFKTVLMNGFHPVQFVQVFRIDDFSWA